MSFEPGWHVDPSNPRQERFWNGTAWSGEWRETGGFQQNIAPRTVRPPGPTDVFVNSSSRSAWFIATSPLWFAVLYFFLSLFAVVSEPAGQVRIAFLVASGILLLLAARRDRAVLADQGVSRPASPWWMALGPLAYLIRRHVVLREVPGFRGSPLTVHVLCIVVIAVAALALLLMSGLSFLLFGGG